MTRATPRLSLLALCCGAALAFAACGDDETNGAGSCSADTECAFGLICGPANTCVELTCSSTGDCLNGDQACVEVAGQDVCAAVECGCVNCDQCAVSLVCDEGVCVDPSTATCDGPEDCDPGEVCDGDTCRPCVGAECAPADCTTTGCDSGQVCDTVTKQCVPDNTSTAAACEPCADAEACGGAPWKCAPLISGNACLPPCSNNDGCPTGWLCQAGNCIPSNYDCESCMGTGCPSGSACNPNSGDCITATAQCESCGNDWECGAGHACNNDTCVPRCADGVCPAGGSCETSGNSIEVCAEACQAACTPACGGATPHCVAGACLECRNTGDCPQGQTCSGGACSGGGDCAPPTPYLWNGVCVACTNNDHCNGLFCDAATNTCQSDACAACAAPYPACTQIGTDFYCVQCASDADCTGGTCNLQTFACEGGVIVPGEPCETDADCDDGGVTGFNLKCYRNAGSSADGLCYDAAGGCDDVTAFCPGTDGQLHECKSILDTFGGTSGLPPELLGGGTIPGNCACSVGTCLEGVTCSKGLFASFLCLADPDPGTCFLNALLPPTNEDGLCGSSF